MQTLPWDFCCSQVPGQAVPILIKAHSKHLKSPVLEPLVSVAKGQPLHTAINTGCVHETDQDHLPPSYLHFPKPGRPRGHLAVKFLIEEFDAVCRCLSKPASRPPSYRQTWPAAGQKPRRPGRPRLRRRSSSDRPTRHQFQILARQPRSLAAEISSGLQPVAASGGILTGRFCNRISNAFTSVPSGGPPANDKLPRVRPRHGTRSRNLSPARIALPLRNLPQDGEKPWTGRSCLLP